MHDLSFFLSEKNFGNNAFQNMFIYQPTLDTLELKKDKGTCFLLEIKENVYF